MTENTQNQEVKEEAGCCCQGKCAEEGQACGCEGKEACTGEEAKQPETPEQTIETLQTALKLSEAKVMEHYDLYVRAMAELENTRRRSSEEVQKARKFGIEKFAENLLPVVDSLEKALEVTKNEEENPVREGMLATYRQFMHALDVSGMKPVDPKGEAFDPLEHQAVGRVEDASQYDETVNDVYQKGYRMADRILRSAMVTVTYGGEKRPAPEPEAAPEDAAADTAESTEE